MDARAESRAVRVNGEVIVPRCLWHCVNPQLCRPEGLGHMICSNSSRRIRMFFINELAVDDETSEQMKIGRTSAWGARPPQDDLSVQPACENAMI